MEKDGLRQKGVDASLAVHELRDPQVHGVARQDVGVVAAQMLLAHQEIEHFIHGNLDGIFQVFVEPHGHEMRGRFGARPAEFHVLADQKLESPAQRSLKRGHADLPVALSRVSVADREQSAFYVQRHVEGRACHELLVIHIARVDPGRPAADASRAEGRDSAPVLHLAPNLAHRGLDLVCRYASEFQVFDRRCDQRLDFNRVPRGDAQGRWSLRVEVTPSYSFRRGGETVRDLGGGDKGRFNMESREGPGQDEKQELSYSAAESPGDGSERCGKMWRLICSGHGLPLEIMGPGASREFYLGSLWLGRLTGFGLDGIGLRLEFLSLRFAAYFAQYFRIFS